MSEKISPLAPKKMPKMTSIKGVQMAAMEAGIRYKGRTDLLLVSFASGTKVAGVLTKSLTASSAVDWCRAHLSDGKASGLVVNSGNANAFTGMAGQRAVEETCKAAAKALGCPKEQVFVASTGVIGEPLDTSSFAGHLSHLSSQLEGDGFEDAAKAIMTTDTFPKWDSQVIELDGQKICFNGIAKGSGMIAPDMATMLSFIFTDLPIKTSIWQKLLQDAVAKSFNMITVDGDTSTSDTVLSFATGKTNIKTIEDPRDPRIPKVRRALNKLTKNLAHLIVKDGEGARKFITINITGAKGKRAARAVAMSIANSPLVKTAIAGEDANWGRIVMAVGKSGEYAERDRLELSIGGVKITEQGQRVKGYDEDPLAKHMKGDHILIDVDLGVGRSKATVWTCDLTHDYISINADYRS